MISITMRQICTSISITFDAIFRTVWKYYGVSISTELLSSGCVSITGFKLEVFDNSTCTRGFQPTNVPTESYTSLQAHSQQLNVQISYVAPYWPTGSKSPLRRPMSGGVTSAGWYRS